LSGLNLKNYKVIRKICRKFCFTVYEALNLIDENRRFLKVLNGELSDDKCAENFLEGARVAGKLDNKNICKVYSFGKENGHYFIDSEPIDSKSLSLHIHEEYPFHLSKVIDILIRVSTILRQAHLAGIIHGVLNPSSLFIVEDGQLRIDDFCHHWIAAYLPKIDESEATYLSYFIAPELFSENQVFDGRADIYSLGVILQQLLTDELPLNGYGKSSAQPRHLNGSVTSLRSLYPEHSPQLDEILKRCLNRNPEQRYFNLSEFVADLESLNVVSSNSEPTPEQIAYSRR